LLKNPRRCFFVLNNNQKLIIIFLVSFSVFLLPQLFRLLFINPTLIGSVSYYHARIARLYASLNFYDDLSWGGRTLTYYPGLPFFLSVFYSIFSDNAFFFFSQLIGALSVVLIAKTLLHYKKDPRVSLVFLLLPVSIYSFGHLNSDSLSFFFGLLFFYALLRGYKRLLFVACFLSGVTHPLVFAYFFVLCLAYSLYVRRGVNRVLLSLVPVLVFYSLYFLFFGLPLLNKLHFDYVIMNGSSLNPSSLDELIMMLHGGSALSIPVLLLSVYGWIKVKKHKKLIAFFVLSTIFLAFLAERFQIFLILPFTMLLSYAFLNINLKPLKAFLVICCIPFILVQIVWLSGVGPSDDFIKLSSYQFEKGVFLTHWVHGHRIAFLTNNPVYWDAYVEYAPQPDQRYEDFFTIMCSNDSQKVKELISYYNISNIILLRSDLTYFAKKGCVPNLSHEFLVLKVNNSLGSLYIVNKELLS